MKPKTALVALAVVLTISVAGNVGQALFTAYNWVDTGSLYSDMSSSFQHQQAEVLALRKFSEALAAGDEPMAALAKVGSPKPDNGWIWSGPLLVKLEGEKLVKVCGAVSTDSCAGDEK